MFFKIASLESGDGGGWCAVDSGICGTAASGDFATLEVMAKVVDPRSLPDSRINIPGLKPPVREFDPSDDGDPSEVDAFNQMIREVRNQSPSFHRDVK